MFTPLAPKQFSDSIFHMKGISKKTVEDHLKLYQGYVNKYNEINTHLQSLAEEEYTKANQVYSPLRALKTELSFAWGGIINHEIYFNHLGGVGGEPAGDLKTQIQKDFGSFEQYRKDLKATGIAARGWVWTGWNRKEERLMNYLGDSQNTYLMWYVEPIAALDTYEHAYFPDYGVNRASYIDAFFQNLNWDAVSDNFRSALAIK
jgi:Fe-Mn family superoxide dismutase